MKKEKFSNLFTFLPKSKIKAGEGKEEGKYPFFKSGKDQSKKIDIAIFSGESLIIGDGGEANISYYDGEFSASDHCYVIQAKSNNIYAKYVYFYLKSHIEVLEEGFKGAGLKNISKKYISNIKIPLPNSIDNQIKIANLLIQVEALIAKREEIIKLLDELLKSTFLDMFGDPVLNTKGWEKVSLSELTTKIGSGSTPKGGKEVYLDSGYYFIRSQNIRMNKIKYETMYCIDETIHNKMKNTWVKNGDVLLNITGASIGRVAYFEGKSNSANVNQHVSILRPKKDVINYIFLSHCISQENFQKEIMRKNVGGTREAFNFTQIKKFKIILPPKPLQDKFATIVQQVEESKKRYQESLNELHQLFGSLSQRAFKGELDLSRMVTEDDWTKQALAKQKVYDEATQTKVYQSGMDSVQTVSIKKIPKENIKDYLLSLIKLNSFDIDDISHHIGNDFTLDELKQELFNLLNEGKIKQIFDEESKKIRFKVGS